jgi:hypothetical protein
MFAGLRDFSGEAMRVITSGLILGFAAALLFAAISYWYFGYSFSQAEQQLSP